VILLNLKLRIIYKLRAAATTLPYLPANGKAIVHYDIYFVKLIFNQSYLS